MWKRGVTGIHEPRWVTRSLFDMSLGLYFLSPLEIVMDLGIAELYKFETISHRLTKLSIICYFYQIIKSISKFITFR
jgi:hypothetical protein